MNIGTSCQGGCHPSATNSVARTDHNIAEGRLLTYGARELLVAAFIRCKILNRIIL